MTKQRASEQLREAFGHRAYFQREAMRYIVAYKEYGVPVGSGSTYEEALFDALDVKRSLPLAETR